MSARFVHLVLSLGIAIRAAPAQDPMSGMHHMGMKHDSAGMPIPMPKGMPMIPGLIGLVPPGGALLPGAGVDPERLPPAKPSEVLRLKSGDTLDLTARLVRRTIKGNA